MDLKSRIIITGGTGFLGQYVVAELVKKGYDNLCPLNSIDYDLRVEERVCQMVCREEPEIIIHLAASVGGIEANRKNPGKFFYDNMSMGLHIIDEAHLHNVKKIVMISTICTYPKFAPVPFKEDDLWNGYPEETNAPYGIAKKALLVMAQAYRRQYGLNTIYLMPVNLFGPGDQLDIESSHVIPGIIIKCIEAQKHGLQEIELWGDGSPTREFLYVEDAARAIVLAMEKYDKPEPVNIGAGFEISILDLANKIKKLTGFKGSIKWNTSRPNGQPRRCLDISRAKEFGFAAEIPFDIGLEKTVRWYEGILK